LLLKNLIHTQLEETAQAFSEFQNKTTLLCPSGCGKCCFKPNITSAPYELFPLAHYLVENNLAEKYLEKIQINDDRICVLLNIQDKENGLGQCSHYEYRPFVCRAFGIAARTNKYQEQELVVCPTLKEVHSIKLDFKDAPNIHLWKKKLEAIDPKLTEKEIPINAGLKILLEKLLLEKQFFS
jgi:Fe-S-cluster containining protein